MQQVLELKAELAHFERQTMRSVTPEQKQPEFCSSARLPSTVEGANHLGSDRKHIIRLLIRDITVVKDPQQPKLLHLQICWQGGATETIKVRRRPNYPEAIRYPDAFVAKIRAMAQRRDDNEIVTQLTSEGLTSSTGKPFTASMIRWIRYRHRISRQSTPDDGTFTVSQVRARYGVSLWVVHYWIKRGIVSATQRKSNAPYAVRIDDVADDGCEIGSRIQVISTRHPQRKLL